jgi:hypothetical protein
MPDWPNRGTLAMTTILITGPNGALQTLKVKKNVAVLMKEHHF